MTMPEQVAEYLIDHFGGYGLDDENVHILGTDRVMVFFEGRGRQGTLPGQAEDIIQAAHERGYRVVNAGMSDDDWLTFAAEERLSDHG